MRLIDADALLERMQYRLPIDNHDAEVIDGCVKITKRIIEAAPTIDAVPVVHGQWVVLDECSNAGAYCSVCHKKVYKECYGNCKMKSTYCPNCGAKMEVNT